MSHGYRRIFAILAENNNNGTLFCSWNAADCQDASSTNDTAVDMTDCLATNFHLTSAELEGVLCCKDPNDVPFFDDIPKCVSSVPGKIILLVLLFTAIIAICSKTVWNVSRIVRILGISTLSNSVGKCVLMCTIAQSVLIVYIFSMMGTYVALPLGFSYRVHYPLGVVSSITLPITFGFAVFATLSMSFNVITVGRTAAMQGEKENSRNTKRLNRLHKLITAATVCYTAMFVVGSFIPGLGHLVILGATLCELLFQIWVFRSASRLMSDLRLRFSDSSATQRSVSGGKISSAKRSSGTSNKLCNNLKRLEYTCNFISKTSAVAAFLLVLRSGNEFVRFDVVSGFNDTYILNPLLQNMAILCFSLILLSISQAIYRSKMEKVKTLKKVVPSVSVPSAAPLFSENPTS